MTDSVSGSTMLGNSSRLLSTRGQNALQVPSPFVKYSMLVISDAYHERTNPKGFIDIGTAENKLMEDIIIPKLASLTQEDANPTQMYYGNLKGLNSFRQELKSLLEDKLHPAYEIDPEHLCVSGGTTPILETLGFAVAEGGDYILVPTPYYYRIQNDLKERADVNCYPVPLASKDSDGRSFYLSAEKLELAYKTATNSGCNVRGLLLINPNNPTGDVYTEQQLMDFLNFAHKYDLHVISDEIYALTLLGDDCKFTSVLALPLPDPQRVHVVWGFSKDFGLSGYRCGVLHTRNPEVLRYAVTVGIFQQTSASVQLKLEHFIKDRAWLDNVYLCTYLQRLSVSYKYVCKRLARIGVKVFHSKGAFFAWADMSQYLKSPTFEAEAQLQDRLIEGKVYILAGKSFYNKEPGWFRIVVSNKMNILEKGMDRVERVLMDAKKTTEITRL